MKIISVKNYEELGKKAAAIIASYVIQKPDSVLGLATGSTPLSTYKNLIQLYKDGFVDFSRIKTANLDEYKGLERSNPQSYYYFMNTNLFDHINIDKANTHIPDGTVEDALLECSNYENLIEELGGVDLQLLGLGHNGHIGFNEPDSSFSKSTHCVDLAESTIKANARFFEHIEEVPTKAYTMGIATIMKAKRILILVSGKDKANIVKKAFFGDIKPEVPASILQVHPDVILIADEDALSEVGER